MNYFLLLVIVGISGGAWYIHQQDQQQIDTLQTQLADAQKKPSETTNDGTPASAAARRPAPVAIVQPTAPIKVIQPMHQSSAIDAAAQAAAAAHDANDIGTVSTLDGRTLTHCHVLKVEADGVTFNHDDGITKVLFPMLPPDVQKKFGYSPTEAVAQTEAQIRAAQAQAALNTNTAAAP